MIGFRESMFVDLGYILVYGTVGPFVGLVSIFIKLINILSRHTTPACTLRRGTQ
jgi:hypothetical protein